MIAARSIAHDELAAWGRLGDADITETAAALEADGTSGPGGWLVAEEDGVAVGRVGLLAEAAGGGSDRREHRIFGLWVDGRTSTERQRVAERLGRAVLSALPEGLQTVDVRSNPETHDDIDTRRALLASVGGRLFQEKVGLVWEDAGPPVPPTDRVRFTDIASMGREAYGDLMGRCQVGTLDRNDRYYIGLCGERGWGTEMTGFLDPADAASWLAAADLATGDLVGFVALGGFDEPATATIVHIGVVPEARGRGYVHDLLAAADAAARRRGDTRIVSDVDTENAPMLAAMARAGHLPGRRPWHVWHDRLSVVVLADGTPVTLRDIDRTDRTALMALRRGPGQERYLGSMESHFDDAAEDARAVPRMWGLHAGDEVVGFVMISDGIPPERLATDDDLVGPYYLWRLLVDAGHQGRGYGRAAIDLVCDHLASRPGADVLWTSCEAGEGSPQPFYLRYGFSPTGEVKWGEDLLRLGLPRRTA